MNGYKDGYAAGKKDAQNGLNKKYNRHISTLKAVMSGAYVDSFIEGYNTGYRDGLR